MFLQVFQIDAWAEGDGSWTYNNSFPLEKFEYKGELTKRKLLNLLRKKGYLPPDSQRKYKVDDYFTFEGMWCVQQRNNGMPVYDVQEFN